jgi:putative SOS response-associated peptidase YedK
MCGRYTIREPQDITEAFGVDDVEADLGRPRYNIAPTQPVPILLARHRRRTLVDAKWGLVPSWAKDPSIGAQMINARAESLYEKPAFRQALGRRRCLVPADGFYEWRETLRGKQPMYIRVDEGRPFAFAGLYEVWHPNERDELRTCTIITTEPNDFMAEIHDRMPAILPREAWQTWLDVSVTQPTALMPLLVPFDAKRMNAHPVATLVNSPQNDDPACVAPVQAPPEDRMLF